MRFLVIFLSLISCNLYSQDLVAFNTVYRKTFLETSQKDFNKALKIADSLYSVSQTPLFKVKSLMLSATLYDQSGEFEKSLKYASKAENIITTTDEVIWKCKIYGFLATHYRYVGLFTKSKTYADLCMQTIQEIEDQEMKYSIAAMAEQEISYYEIEKKNYKKSLVHLNRAQTNLNKSKISNDVSKITNSQLFGLNYYHLDQLDRSLHYYSTALNNSKNLPENYLIGLIHNGLSLVYLKKDQLKEAKKHLDIAKRIADESKYLSLQNEVYETSEKYYATTKNIEELTKANEKHENVRKRLENKTQSFVNSSFTKIEEENNKVKSSNVLRNSILGICIALLVTSVITIFIYRKRSKKKIESFKKLLEEIDHQKTLSFNNNYNLLNIEKAPLSQKKLTTEDPFMVPEETVKKIMTKLKDFEKSQEFLQSTISFPYVAGYCETNTKYLSYVIRTRKEKDFSSYINELRINYIIDKFRKSPKYRNYKISTLAEEAGFSSANKLSLIFKKVTGYTPSAFIKNLQDIESTDK
jgi:tetratricopeptide (TPR) repeat protein